jgi:hypothetical protein
MADMNFGLYKIYRSPEDITAAALGILADLIWNFGSNPITSMMPAITFFASDEEAKPLIGMLTGSP